MRALIGTITGVLAPIFLTIKGCFRLVNGSVKKLVFTYFKRHSLYYGDE